MLTGEAMPVTKRPGDEVIGATLNTTGSFVMRATRVGSETALAQIVELVRRAQGSKAPIQRLADRISGIFVPAVLGVSALTFTLWWLLGPEPKITLALAAFITVVVIACPCAMGLATPTAIMVGTGRGAEAGILFRGGEALESAQRVTTVLFDKTGTLTAGTPAVAELVPAPGFGPIELLRLAAAVEAGSEHPIAGAILRAARDRGLSFPGADQFEAVAGGGAAALVDGAPALVGNARLLAERGIDPGSLAALGDAQAGQGRTPVLVARDGAVVGLIAVADPVKPEAAEAVRALAAQGVTAWLVTGDHRATAESVALAAGIPTERVRAGILPGDKAALVAELQAAGAVVAMVGDGINDAPALASADLGVAIGTGADVAIEASDVTLVGGDPRGVVAALALSRRTMAVIRQNLFWAFAYNVVLVPVAMGILYPPFGITINPAMAAGAMALSSVSVISNSLRLRAYDPRPAAVLAESGHAAWTRVRDTAYLAVIAALAIAVAASVIAFNRWLDGSAVPVALRASALAAPAPIYQVAAGEQVRVTYTNDADDDRGLHAAGRAPGRAQPAARRFRGVAVLDRRPGHLRAHVRAGRGRHDARDGSHRPGGRRAGRGHLRRRALSLTYPMAARARSTQAGATLARRALARFSRTIQRTSGFGSPSHRSSTGRPSVTSAATATLHP